jgi:signal transduction histidine kinase
MGFLQGCRLFDGLGADELQRLEDAGQLRSFGAGQVVFESGDPGDGLYLVVQGLINISVLVGDANRRVLARIRPGDFFGEMAAVDEHPRSATATTQESTRLFFIPTATMLEALDRSPALAVNLVREFSRRMRKTGRLYVEEVLTAERLTLVGRFARSIVHDFKNPLSIIGMATDLGTAEDASPALRETTKNQIRKQVVRLSNMIDEVLEFTSGSTSTSLLIKTDFAAFVLPLLEDLRAETALKHVAIELQTPVPAMTLPLDTGRLTNAFYNLVNNAVDALQPDGGKIFFRFAVTEEAVLTEIEDTGKGIAPEIAGRLFEPFVTHGKTRGTGLGLSICRRIIQDHGGNIQAHVQPGRGARFSFSLPRR